MGTKNQWHECFDRIPFSAQNFIQRNQIPKKSNKDYYFGTNVATKYYDFIIVLIQGVLPVKMQQNYPNTINVLLR